MSSPPYLTTTPSTYVVITTSNVTPSSPHQEATFGRIQSSAHVASLLNAAMLLHNSGKCMQAITMYQQAWSEWTKDTREEKSKNEPEDSEGDGIDQKLFDETSFFFHNSIGLVYDSIGDDEAALSCYLKGKEAVRSFDANDPRLAISFSNIGSICYHSGKVDVALQCFDQAMVIRAACTEIGPAHILTAAQWNNVGCCLDILGRTEEAVFRFQHAFDIFRGSFGLEHPRTRLVHRNFERARARPMKIRVGKAPLSIKFRTDLRFSAPGDQYELNTYKQPEVRCSMCIQGRGDF